MATIEFYIPGPNENSVFEIGGKKLADAWLRNIEKSSRNHHQIQGPCRMIANFILPEEWLSRHRILARDLVGLFSPVYAGLRKSIFDARKPEDLWIDRIVLNKVWNASESEMGVRIQIDWDESVEAARAT